MISILYGLYKLALFIIIYNKGSQVLQVNTIFIRLSAQGAYLIFGFSGWALIRGGRLFEAGHLLNFHHFHFTLSIHF